MKLVAAPKGRKLFEIFNGLFDYGAGTLRSGFYPSAIGGGQSAPPINIAPTASGTTISPQSTLEISTAWACVWLITDTIATLPFELNERVGNNRWGSPAYTDPLYVVLGRSPNAMQTAAEFWQFMHASQLLWGNAYAEITRNGAGDVIALSPMLAQYTIPYKDQATGDLRYKYLPGGVLEGPQMDLPASQVFHMKDHSIDGLVGLSRVQYGRNSFGIARAGEQSQSDIFRNGMRSNGFLMYDKVLKPEQRIEIKSTLNSFRNGGADAGSYMVLEGGMKFDGLSMTPQDSQLLASREFSVADICRWYGVPPVLIGHSGTTAWGSGIEQLLLGFISLTVRPFIRRTEQSVNRALVQLENRATQYLTIDTDDLTGADSNARSALYSSAGQNGWMTRNEIRAKEDLPPMDGGDSLTVQSNLIPIDKLGQTPPTPGAPDQPVEKEPVTKPPAAP